MKEKQETIIPKATAKRLSLYYRYLKTLHAHGVKRINSNELSEGIQIDSATIRRDFSYFGELGKRGYGYDVENLMNFFARILSDDQLTNVALIGVGNLGHALLNFKFNEKNNIKIAAAFDKDPQIIGQVIANTKIYDMGNLKEILEEKNIHTVILSIPERYAQEVTNQLVEIGVKGILNFTPRRILTPSSVIVQSVDLTNELQTLIYFMKKNKTGD